MLTESAVELLRRQPFVAALQPWQVDRLATMATEATFEPNDVIFYEGEECSQFYLIVAGRVAVEITTPKRAFRIDTLAAGDELGWSSVLAGKGKYFQARALQPVRALQFDGAELIHHFQTDPALGTALLLRLLEVVSGRLEATRLQVLDMYWPAAKQAGA
jgi:CRP/FNR family transcriptional regulator, cyclic AMP receptor protein